MGGGGGGGGILVSCQFLHLKLGGGGGGGKFDISFLPVSSSETWMKVRNFTWNVIRKFIAVDKIYMLLIAIFYDKGDWDTLYPFTDFFARNGGFETWAWWHDNRI